MLQRRARPLLSPSHPHAEQEVERENKSDPHSGAEVSKGAALPAGPQASRILTPDQLLPNSRIPWGKSHSHPYYKSFFLGHLVFIYYSPFLFLLGFPDGSVIKILPAKQEIWIRSIPGWERFPGEGNDNLLLFSCLENPMDRGAWLATTNFYFLLE